jgi:hypothetical protein
MRAALNCAQLLAVAFSMPRFIHRAVAVLTLTALAAGCSVTSHDLGASPVAAGKVASVQHIERLEWHRNVDENGHILDDGDDQFTVLNSATVTNDSLDILTGVGFAPGEEGERRLIRIGFGDIVEIKLITHPLSAVNMVLPLNAGLWGSRVLITTKDGSRELLSVAKGDANAPELFSPTRGVFLPPASGSHVIRGLWWPDRTKTRELAALLQEKVAAYQER